MGAGHDPVPPYVQQQDRGDGLGRVYTQGATWARSSSINSPRPGSTAGPTTEPNHDHSPESAPKSAGGRARSFDGPVVDMQGTTVAQLKVGFAQHGISI
jgi:hypothetical protein